MTSHAPGIAGSAARSYVFAKTCALLAKSPLSRLADLAACQDAASLERLVFDTQTAASDASSFEERARERIAAQIRRAALAYRHPPLFLILLISAWEYGAVKGALAALAAGEAKCPTHADLGPFCTVRWAAWPDLGKMLDASKNLKFLLDTFKPDASGVYRPAIEQVQEAHLELDRRYYKALLSSLKLCSRTDVSRIRLLLKEEISLRNCLAVLRLRTVYNMTGEAVKKMLIPPYTEDAEAALSLPLDSLAEWKKWPRSGLLNKESSGEFWKASPLYFQAASQFYLYTKTKTLFKSLPFALDTCALFIRLKQFEDQILRGAAESLRMGEPVSTVLAIYGLHDSGGSR